MRYPEEIRHQLEKRWRNQRRGWLQGWGQWPQVFPLGAPTPGQALSVPEAVWAWVKEWQQWSGPGELVWAERRLGHLGSQRLPLRILLHNPDQVAGWLGQQEVWERALRRHGHLAQRWPALAAPLAGYFEVLAQAEELDLQRLEAMLAWLQEHPDSGLYPRQLPIAGLDSKWLEERKALIAELLAALQEEGDVFPDFYARCGLKPPPRPVRVRLLDPLLRRQVGGLGDLAAPVEELSCLDLPVRRVFIVENQQTGLAFTDLPESAVIFGLGYGVDALASLDWLAQAECYYWGDLDTHGLAILNRARAYLPHLRSLLMDEETLLAHRELWGQEDTPSLGQLPLLNPAEQELYQGLRQQRWGRNVRLEQERVEWSFAWSRLNSGGPAGSPPVP